MPNNCLRKYFVLSVCLAALFVFIQAGEIKGDTDTDQLTLSVMVAGAINIDCGADVDLGTLTPGSPVYDSTVCAITTSAADGYDLKVKRDDADTTMDKVGDAATNITDKTAWDPTANAGAGNAAVWAGTGLAFGVYGSSATKNTTWWGDGDACDHASNKYAGFPDAYATVMDHDAYSDVSTSTSICYKLDVGGAQSSGSYDGTITYQSVTKP